MPPTNASRRPLEAVLYCDGLQLGRCLIRRGRYILGSERKNEIVINEPSVSGLHARLTVESEDEIYLEDLGSANGTTVEGRAIDGSTRVALDAEILLGSVALCFERGSLPAVIYAGLRPGFLRPLRYDIGEIVVQGSTSTIYQAHDTSLGRDVALKVMLPASQRDPATVLRFVREAQISAQLSHPGILPIYELGLDEQGRLFTATRFVEGESLGHLLNHLASGDAAKIAQYSLASLLHIWQRVCNTVACAHSRGVVHGALNPEVVEIGRFGEVFVTGWNLARIQPEESGIAHRVQAPESNTTPPLSPFSAPEQAAGEPADPDPRTDVFRLGGLLYHILTLRDPLSGETEDALLEAALNASVTPPDKLPKASPHPHWPRGRLPEFPSAVAMKAMSYAPENRHASVAELQRELAAWQEGAATGEVGQLWKQFTGLLRPH